MAVPVLEMKSISKSYDTTQVLKDVNLTVEPGQIHCLVGENGAGKSTLMNILFGMPVISQTGGYEGEVRINGELTKFGSPRDAIKAGIGMVHQEFMLLPGFTIAENIKLNREITKPSLLSPLFGPKLKVLDRQRMGQDARAALDKLGMDLDEWAPVAGLPVGYMQFVEIAREIDKEGLKLLVLDEPTAVLTEGEADTFLEVVRRLSQHGISILFITHRLDEVMAVADVITILKDGKVVQCKPKTELTVSGIAEMMVGREIENRKPSKQTENRGSQDKPILELRDLWVNMPGEQIRGVDLTLYEGEILGIGGLAGHGKIGIANGVMGLYPSEGEIIFRGQSLTLNDPANAIKQGLAFVSEDRRGVGLVLEDSIENNIVMTSMQMQKRFLKEGWIRLRDDAAIREHALRSIEEFDIRCTGPEQIVRRLSGGNQQKVCLARAFTQQPSILFVSEPTRGIDVGAKARVLDMVVKLNKELGVTVVITSSELSELRSVCDRIAIVYEGRMAGILAPDAPNVNFGLLMAGRSQEEGKVS